MNIKNKLYEFLFAFRRQLVWASLYCAFVALIVVAFYFAPDKFSGQVITVLWLVTVTASAIFIFPSKGTAAVVPILSLGLWWALSQATTEKMNLTNFPLTALDIRMFVANPTGLLNAIRAPEIFYLVFSAMPFVIALLLLLAIFWRVRRGLQRSLFVTLPAYFFRLSVVGLGLFALFTVSANTVASFAKVHGGRFDIWSDEGLVKFANALGVIPFVIYSELVENDGTQNFLNYQAIAQPPSPEMVLGSASKFLNFSVIKQRTLPNIILIHAESAFDPNDVFNLVAPTNNEMFYSTPLPTPDDKIQFRGPGLANVIGGGSWVSEFEVVHGIDSRLFGVSGRYTHASLSQFSKNSLARYLISRGYHATVATTDAPTFYSYGIAYKRYGFERFYGNMGDNNDDDLATMSASLELDRHFAESNRPFLKYIMVTNNHSPHSCVEAPNVVYGVENFVGDPTKVETCALREYVRRARETSQAIGNAKAYLEDIKSKTGRPYVIAVYGDHQPHSFTGTGAASHNMGLNLDRFRKDKEKRKVIIELISSAETPFSHQWEKPIPLTLLPTMISAYVATSPAELYLPESLYAFDRCGSDFIGQLTGSSFYGVDGRKFQSVCSSFDEVVAALKKRNIIGVTPSIEPIVTLSVPSNFQKCSPKTMTIAAAGSHFEGAPEVAVSVNGIDLGQVKLSDDSSFLGDTPLGIVKDFAAPRHTFTFPNSAAIDNVEIRFTNDLWKSAKEDRNVNLHQVLLDNSPLSNYEVRFDPNDGGWVNPNGVIQIFKNTKAIFKGPFAQDCQ